MSNWKCFLCGGQVIWQSDFDFEDYGYEGEGIVQNYTCSKCGAEYEVRSSFKDEEDTQTDDGQITFEELENYTSNG